MNMKHANPILRVLIGLLLAALTCVADAQEPTQQPLLTRASAVAPNLLILFDDSDSMNYRYVYEASVRSDPRRWFGLNPTADELKSLTGDLKPLSDIYAFCAPELNKIAYNPDKRYDPPKNADGSFQINGDINAAKKPGACRDNANNPVVYRFPKKYFIFLPENYVTTAIISTNNSYPKTAKRTDCKGTTCTYQEEIQNYANWFQYHRTRLGMFKTALSHAIAAVPDSLRLGATGINSLVVNRLVDMVPVPLDFAFNHPLMPPTNRHLFHNWLEAKGTVSGTRSNEALYQAGNFFSRSDSDGPWGTSPNPYSRGTATVASPLSKEPSKSHASCRRSYAMLVTDGYYTDIYTPVGEVDNVDGPSITNDSGSSNYQYKPEPPFSSPHKGSMADIAMKFWGTDLRAGKNGIDNNVTPILGANEDKAFWQHMNFMAVTLGLEGTLARTQQTIDEIKAGSKSWPAPAVLSPQAMDDIWHATINGRGDLINVTDSEEMTQAFTTLVSGILRASATQGGVAASTTSLTSGTKKFIPVFTSGQWTGNLIAVKLNATTGHEEAVPLWQVEKTNKDTGEELSNTLGPHADRNIVVGTGGTAPSAMPFKYADMSSALRDRVSTTDAANLINYLRGDRTHESGANDIYRKRAFILGDIVNSNPTFVGPDIDQGYGKLANAANAQSYIAYLSTKRSRTDGLIFIGANDGMLHAFRESDGKEVFAYIPYAVTPLLHKLARKDYEHRFFVDGPTSQGDFQRPNGKWNTAVLASAGAGAKSVFAINATSNTLGTATVMWEVHNGMQGFEEMGNVLSEVRMGRRNGGTHVAVFGNGYYSKSGKAQLFVVNMMTGALVAVLDTREGDNNGLGGVELVLDDNNIVVGAYAGDLKGNLWKFDMRSADPNDWKVSSNPVFKARTSTGAVQPITAAPLSIKHPDGGRVVVLGTGRFFDAADVSNKDGQTIYGVRDKDTFTNMSSTSIDGTSTLVMQELITKQDTSRIVTAFDDTTSTQTVTYYEVSVNPIDWSIKNGWYFHQPFSGQRMVYPVSRFADRLAKVDTIVPGSLSNDVCTAATPGTGYNYIIDMLSGGSPQGPILDTNGDGVVNSGDISGSGYSTTVDGRDTVLTTGSLPPKCLPEGGPPIKLVILNSSGGSTVVEIECKCTLPDCKPCIGPNCPRQPKTVKGRSWQQLFLR